LPRYLMVCIIIIFLCIQLVVAPVVKILLTITALSATHFKHVTQKDLIRLKSILYLLRLEKYV